MVAFLEGPAAANRSGRRSGRTAGFLGSHASSVLLSERSYRRDRDLLATKVKPWADELLSLAGSLKKGP
jgi:hypothetical protein